MDSLEFIKWAIFGLMSVAVWFTKRTIDTTEVELRALKLEMENIKENYMLRSDFKEFKMELRHMFEELKADIRTLRT